MTGEIGHETMHAFHEYLIKQLYGHLKARRVVCWYDANEEFGPFLDELQPAGEEAKTRIGDLDSRIVRYDGSFFALRAKVEPLVATDQPEPLLIYIPGVARDRTWSVLMELEKAGHTYEPQLKRLARNVLRNHYTDGDIDGMLDRENLTYEDVAHFVQQAEGGEGASILKTIFESCRDSIEILACWLADESKDAAILNKDAAGELLRLVGARLGVAPPEDSELSDARARTARYVLVNEFRADLKAEAPSSVAMIPEPPTKDHLARTQEVARALRATHPAAYTLLADKVESDLGLRQADLDAAALGPVDTFRFEENLLLNHCGRLIVDGQYVQTMEVITGRDVSFWVHQDVTRQAQWEACRLMAELGAKVQVVNSSLSKMPKEPAVWVAAYAAEDGWCRADQFQRQLEAWVAKMDEDLAEQCQAARGFVLDAYEELLRKMAEGFSASLRQAAWTVQGVLHQTRVFPELVEPGGGRVAYFLVDAMRYEMGVELTQQLRDAEDLAIRPAIAALPTITPVGMAALLPGASGSFSVVEAEGKIAARINGTILPGSAERAKVLKAAIPAAADETLGKLLQRTPGRLPRSVKEADLLVVRCQEIDALGEMGDDLIARQLMDTMVGNIARAVRKLSGLGYERFVIAADHGYQFAGRKGEDMRLNAPGGDTVSIHRRCWIGRGGSTPSGTVRVAGAELGYETDMEFVFPTGLAVFPSAGGLSYHHGGISLQELLVPAVTFRLPVKVEARKEIAKVKLTGCPATLTNRTFGIKVAVAADLFGKEAVPLRIVLVSEGQQVGQAGMAIDASFDREKRTVAPMPGKEASVGMMLTRDDCQTVRVVVQDPATDAVLAHSDDIPVNLGI